MSIEMMTRVWKESKNKGTPMLLLLAVADHADEMGFAWPGIVTLSEKIRMSHRHTRRMLLDVEAFGELFIDRREHYNRYVVTVGMSDKQLMTVLTDKHRLGYSFDEAAAIVVEIRKRQQQGDKLSSCLEGETAEHEDNLSPSFEQDGDIQGQHRDISGQHEDTHVRKADTDVPLIIKESSLESSINQEDDEEEGADRILATVVALYEQEIGGTLTAMVAEELRELTELERNLERWQDVFRRSVGKAHRWAWIRKVIANPLPQAPPAKPGTGKPGAGKRPATGGRPTMGAPTRTAEQARIQELIKSRNAGGGG